MKNAEPPQRRTRVVIAEDFVLIQENIRRVIESDCDVVATADDGESALELTAAHLPDVLLLDISLPGINGFVVAERLLQSTSVVKVIMLTAHADRNYVEHALSLGVKGYVLKGTMWTELTRAIREVVAGGVYLPVLIP